ncbi:MAG: cell division topological specificity factor MinE [Synergistetes bacterium]|nr:cell division topological specificity factor MinE [Synergistota bacterium]
MLGIGGKSSKEIAKDRLRVALVYDKTDISPKILEEIRAEIISVISKRLVIKEENIDITLEREGSTVALVTSIPIVKVKRGAEN